MSPGFFITGGRNAAIVEREKVCSKGYYLKVSHLSKMTLAFWLILLLLIKCHRRARVSVRKFIRRSNLDLAVKGPFGFFNISLIYVNAFKDTPAGSNVTVSPDSNTMITFSEVSSPGDTTVSIGPRGPNPPDGFMVGNFPFYYDITTTAVYAPPVIVCLSYNPLQFNNQDRLRLFHYENNQWVDVTTSIDSANHILCGQVNSLTPQSIRVSSPSIIAYPKPLGEKFNLNKFRPYEPSIMDA